MRGKEEGKRGEGKRRGSRAPGKDPEWPPRAGLSLERGGPVHSPMGEHIEPFLGDILSSSVP